MPATQVDEPQRTVAGGVGSQLIAAMTARHLPEPTGSICGVPAVTAAVLSARVGAHATDQAESTTDYDGQQRQPTTTANNDN